MKTKLFRVRAAAAAALLVAASAPASAQIDPLYFMRGQAFTNQASNTAPNVVFVVDVANRMQRGVDLSTDLTNVTTATNTSHYYDPFIYTKTGAVWEPILGVGGNTVTNYRRRYRN